jgi:hypothetical protein
MQDEGKEVAYDETVVDKEKLTSATIDFLDIILHPVILLKNNVSETEFCLRPQVKAYSVGPNGQMGPQ